MAVRPFYLTADIEGRKTELAGGTRHKEGRQSISILQRDEGCITKPYTIEQSTKIVDGKKKLVTEVFHLGELISTHVTAY